MKFLVSKLWNGEQPEAGARYEFEVAPGESEVQIKVEADFFGDPPPTDDAGYLMERHP